MADISVNFEELAPGTIVHKQYESTGFVFVEVPGAPLPSVRRLEWPGYRKNVLDFRSGVEVAFSEARLRFTRPHARLLLDILNLKDIEALVHVTYLDANGGNAVSGVGGGSAELPGPISMGVGFEVNHQVADIWGVHIRAGGTHQRIGLAALSFDDTAPLREIVGDRRLMPKMKLPR